MPSRSMWKGLFSWKGNCRVRQLPPCLRPVRERETTVRVLSANPSQLLRPTQLHRHPETKDEVPATESKARRDTTTRGF